MAACRYEIRVPAEARCLRAVRAFVAAALPDRLGETVDRIVLALDEACANIIRHRNARMGCNDIELHLELDDGSFRCRISSFCANDDVAHIRPRDEDDPRCGGLGTRFIAQIMDRVEYEPDPHRPGAMTLLLEKALPGAAES